MPSVVHVVATDKFAGVERYVCNTAAELAGRGWHVAVVGGHSEHMPTALGSDIRWLPGATTIESTRSLMKLGRQDVCHAHMTVAEGVSIAARPFHRAPVVSTRHFAARRGSRAAGRLLAPLISRSLSRQIAVSEFVASNIERAPDAVVPNGVPLPDCLWQSSSRVVLILQRLEREKDTLTALDAWQRSRLFEEGWSLRVVGDGNERDALEAWVASGGVNGVVFTGWTPDVMSEFARAGMLLASAPAEPCGLAVLEAMGAGVPAVACGTGGHLETVGLLPDASLFSPGDAEAAATGMRSLASDQRRRDASAAGRQLVADHFTVERHVNRLLVEYEAALSPSRKRPVAASEKTEGGLRELVVCSLEAWDDVWRRNQFLADVLLRRNPTLRVLFVEPPTDPLFDLVGRRAPILPRLRRISTDGRLRALRPLKVLPRRAGPIADRLLRGQVLLAARIMGLSNPTLWINDVTYAPMIASTGWPAVYDVTDDWLLAPFAPREVERLRELDELALDTADEVVVCSQALAVKRGVRRPVSVIPNGVDFEHFKRPRPRPRDLPDPPVAAYVGSLHDSRIDVELVVDLARALPGLNVVLVGPNALGTAAQRAFAQLRNIVLLGSRSYEDVPAYLQHADVVVVPHRVSPFTESLDPIKAYECLSIDTPTVATPVSGFRDYPVAFNIVERDLFAARVADVLKSDVAREGCEPPGWEERAVAFEDALWRAAAPR